MNDLRDAILRALGNAQKLDRATDRLTETLAETERALSELRLGVEGRVPFGEGASLGFRKEGKTWRLVYEPGEGGDPQILLNASRAVRVRAAGVIGERIAFRRAKVAEIREKPEAQFDSDGRLSEYGAAGKLRQAGFGADGVFAEIAPVGGRVKREEVARREEQQREYLRTRRAEYLARPLADLVTVYGENRVVVDAAPGYSDDRYTSEVLPEDPEVRDRYAASRALGEEKRAEIRARRAAEEAAEEAEKAADREAFVAYAKGSAQLAPAAEDGYDIVPAVVEEIARLAHAEILAALENAGYGPDCGRHVAESPSPDRDAPLYPGPLAAAVAIERDLRGRLARIPLPARGLKVELSRILSGRFGGEKAPILFVTFSGELIETLAYGIDLRRGD